uniref:B2 mating type protein n=1 Tax=Heterobasidion abietinum TaxID=207833 RepID=S5RU42_9AGAM|nr:b2 mating type protein [Heterobasidion abietinum]
MYRPSEAVSPGNALQRILDASHVITLVTQSHVAPRLNLSSTLHTMPAPKYSFPLPQPLTSELISLGLRDAIAHNLSQAYSQAVMSLKDTYEAELRRTDSVCFAIILSRGSLIPKFQLRMRALYYSNFSAKAKLWADQGMLNIRQRLMEAALKPGLRMTSSEVHREDNDPIHTADVGEFDRRKPVLDLQPLFQQPSKADATLFHSEIPSYAFPVTYPYAMHDRDSCLQILSRGLRQAIRHASQPADITGLLEALNKWSASESPESNDKKKNLVLPSHLTPRSLPPKRSSSSSSSSSSRSLTSPSPPMAIDRPSVPSSLPTPPHSPKSSATSSLQTKKPVLKISHRRIAALPQRTENSGDGRSPATQTSFLSSEAISFNTSSSISPPVANSGRPIPVVTRSSTQTASTSTSRNRKFAALPTRRVRMSALSSLPVPPTPSSASLEPLSMANVSSLSQSSSPSTRSRSVISRTPSLVSLSSSDSESASSDELNTPPSSPSPFITKFPSSVSPSSKFFTSKNKPGLSSSGVFQIFQAPLPKLEVTSPAPPAPSFSFSPVIKREEEPFSFTISR